ncbi:MAG: hypothetical protein WCL16_05450 [bacterium]
MKTNIPEKTRWTAVGMSGGGGTETPAISPHDPNFMLINCDMSGAYRSLDGGRNWELLHWRQLTGCPFCAPCFHPADPDLVLAAFSYAATLKISRDRGASWNLFGKGLGGDLRWIGYNPDDPQVVVASTTRSIYFSQDGGENWLPGRGFEGQALGVHFDRTANSAKRRCFAATREAIYRSDNGGQSWAAIAHPPDSHGFQFQAFAAGSTAKTGACVLYAWVDGPAAEGEERTPGYISRSMDGGQTWARTAGMGVPEGCHARFHGLLTTDLQPATIYAVRPTFSADQTVMRSDDAGETWRSVAFCDKADARYNLETNYITLHFLPESLWGWDTCAAAIDPKDPQHLLFNHYCSIFITTNGGHSWQSGETWRKEPGQPSLNSLWVNNGLVNTTTWNYYVDPFDPTRHYICYTDIGSARSVDAGHSWIWGRNTGPNTYEYAFDPEVPGRMWGAWSAVHDIPNNNTILSPDHHQGRGSVGYSDDHGATWSGRNRGLPGFDAGQPYDWSIPTSAGACVISVIADPRSSRHARRLFASIWEHGVYCSEDGGLNWTARTEGLGAPGINQRACRLFLHADGSLFCLVTGKTGKNGLRPEGVGLYRSRNDGKTWEIITGSLNLLWPTDYAVDPHNSRTIYLAACDPSESQPEGGLYRTEDGGISWALVRRESGRHFSAAFHPSQPGWIYMTLNYNEGKCSPLWLSRDRGETWAPIEDYPFCSAQRVHFNQAEPGIIYVSTYGASIWRGPESDQAALQTNTSG